MTQGYEITTHAPGETRRLGWTLGKGMRQGCIVRLYGDLGSGKTCFIQGLARGLEVPEAYDITSPTYTLIHEYPGRLALVHVDLYRLADAMAAESIGLWDLCGPQAVVAVEWAERLPDSEWPPESMAVRMVMRDESTRRICLNGYGLEQDNLIKGALELWKS